uniref:ShKT domain-containing protein n=1 Tax=Acrobeloides nanus TaxID=290746 RepID=A0A914DSD9_9BILA
MFGLKSIPAILFFLASFFCGAEAAACTATTCLANQNCLSSNAVGCTNTLGDVGCNGIFMNTYDHVGNTVDPNCNNQSYSQLLSGCALACGACCINAANSCTNPGASACSLFTLAQCTNPATQAMLQVNCPALCGTCASSGCADSTTITCSSYSVLCTSSIWGTYIKLLCPRTCGTCSTTATTVSSGSISASTTCGNDSR